ncbi:heavy-metal-associated domain-containing protein [Desulfocurvus sp. DL9XJH121]
MKKLQVNGMSCGHCTASVTEALSKVPGVSGVDVSLEDKAATFEAAPSVNEDQVKAAITAIGFEVGDLTEE